MMVHMGLHENLKTGLWFKLLFLPDEKKQKISMDHGNYVIIVAQTTQEIITLE